MIDWHHPRIYERLRCFGLTLFTLGVASHNEFNPPVAIATILVATLLVVRLRIELGIGRDEDFLTCVYRLISAYEQGSWDEAEELSQKCRIPCAAVGQAYIDSTIWAEQVVHLVAL